MNHTPHDDQIDKNPAAQAHDNGSGEGGGHHVHTITPFSVYYKVFGCLIFLTALTVATSLHDFGLLNIVVAMIIAVTKASLVVLFFMQLRGEGIENKVTFAAAFAFLFIFFALTSADFFFRHEVQPIKVEAQADDGPTDQNVLRIATPALVSKGKQVYQEQCVSCHGVEGKGNGVAAAGLNPPPRNYTTNYWRYGGSPTRIFHTLTNGSPGTGMAAYNNLSIETRYALAHYVRTFAPGAPADTPADLKAAGLMDANGKAIDAAEKASVQLPIDVAMGKLEVQDQILLPSGGEIDGGSRGAKLYNTSCVSCHGINGGGAQLPYPAGQNPHVDIISRSFHDLKNSDGSKGLASWFESEKGFIASTAQGIPGHAMPGMANFTDQEWSDLYNYVKEIAQASPN